MCAFSIGFTVDMKPATQPAAILGSSAARYSDRYPPIEMPTHPMRAGSTSGRVSR
jgi:hypothetical protein